MTILNYTPHEIRLMRERDILVLLPSGNARCEFKQELIDRIEDIDVYRNTFGDVYNLPDPQPDTIYIVSSIVAEKLKHDRDDLYVTNGLVRDSRGAILGCTSLARIM